MLIVKRFQAAWVFPVDQPPIENGLVEVVDRRITAVRSATIHDSATNLGDVAIVPGFVNAHAHLEFSLVESPFLPARPFVDWIRSLMAYRRHTFRTDESAKLKSIKAGWLEAARSGTTTIGEIATDGWSATAFEGPGPRVVPFRELIALKSEAFDRQEEIASDFLKNDLAGLSPHAPYSVAPELLSRLVRLAERSSSTVAMHLAETREELELLASGRSELAEMLRGFGAIPANGLATGRRPLDVLRTLADAPRALIVHGNYLDDDELDFIAARSHLSVVYCPRTHDFFGHEPHPWKRLLAKGAGVAIGTDGRGSNPDLSLWNELVFLRNRNPDVSPQTLLELGTKSGAQALGLLSECGTITVGKRADLAVVSLNSESKRSHDPYELLFVAEGQSSELSVLDSEV